MKFYNIFFHLIIFTISSLNLLSMDNYLNGKHSFIQFCRENNITNISIDFLENYFSTEENNINNNILCEDISYEHQGLVHKDIENGRSIFVSPPSIEHDHCVYLIIPSKIYGQNMLRYKYTERFDYQLELSTKINRAYDDGFIIQDEIYFHFLTLLDIEAVAIKKHEEVNSETLQYIYVGETKKTILERAMKHRDEIRNYNKRFMLKVKTIKNFLNEYFNVAIFPAVINIYDKNYRELCELILTDVHRPIGSAKAPRKKIADLHEEYRQWKMYFGYDKHWLINRANQLISQKQPLMPKRLKF